MDLYSMSVWQLLRQAGPLIWPIVLCSVIGLAVAIEKFAYLRRLRIDSRRFLDELLDKLKHHQIKEAVKLCDSADHPVANILKAGVIKYDRPRSQIQEAIQDASLYEIPRLEKNLPALAAIAQVAPLLGLLGTVTGMIRYFQAVQHHVQQARVLTVAHVAAGLWEALLLCAAGLLVAIPAQLLYSYFLSRVNALILEIEQASTELVNFLTE